MTQESLFDFCGNVPLADRRDHRRLAGLFQDILTFRGEEKFDERHRVLLVLRRTRRLRLAAPALLGIFVLYKRTIYR